MYYRGTTRTFQGMSAILAPDGLCKRGPKCRYVHTLRELREQWLVMYRTLIASPHNPRNDLGTRSPYPKQAAHIDHNPPTEFKQQPNRQSFNANYAPRDNNNSFQPHYSNKQPIPNNTTRTSPEPTLAPNNHYAKPPAPPYRSMLANPTKQQQSLEIPTPSPPYAQLSNLEAVYAVLPNEHTITVDPNMPELLKRLTAHEMNLTRE